LPEVCAKPVQSTMPSPVPGMKTLKLAPMREVPEPVTIGWLIAV
jgi:hypothetical protein